MLYCESIDDQPTQCLGVNEDGAFILAADSLQDIKVATVSMREVAERVSATVGFGPDNLQPVTSDCDETYEGTTQEVYDQLMIAYAHFQEVTEPFEWEQEEGMGLMPGVELLPYKMTKIIQNAGLDLDSEDFIDLVDQIQSKSIHSLEVGA